LGLVVSAQHLGAANAEKAAYTYEGVKNCKMCHKKAATGDQYTQWLSTEHAKAYANLASEKSVAKAKEMGIADPQKEPKCLECHITAFPVMADLATQSVTLEEGVSCESCHGPGSGYQKKATMQAITDGKIDGASVGLLPVTKETCAKCHDPNPNNPFHKPFNFEEASKKIAHPIPKAAGEAKPG